MKKSSFTLIKPSLRQESGFGIVESVTASAILAVLIISSVSLVSTIEKSKYNASLRDAVRQVIDDDISKLKSKLFEFHYVPSQTSGTIPACYQSNSSCSGANTLYTSTQQHMLICRSIGTSAISYLGGSRRQLLLNASTHKVFTRSPLTIIRSMASQRPSGTVGYTNNSDLSLVNVTYRVAGNATTFASPGLLANSSTEVLRVEKLYPDAHAYCNPE